MRKLAAGLALAMVAWVPHALAQNQIAVWVTGEPGQPSVYQTLAANYNATHPDTKFVVTVNSSDIFNPALVPAISAGEGPELFMFGTGPGQPAAIIESQLVADLTPYFHKYHWDEIIPQVFVNQTSSDGKLWAVGNEVETTAMFYNKAIFSKVGIGVPKTWAEMQDDITKLKAAGYKIPIALGGSDKWPISHLQSMMFGRYATPDGINKVMFGDGKWDAPPFVAAATKLQDMAKGGDFGPSPVAQGYDELMEKFWSGEIPMTYTGSFAIDSGVKAAGSRIGDFGVFEMPPLEDGQKIYPSEGIGSGWYIRANSTHKDAIADFIDYMMFSKEGRRTLLENGTTPVGPVSADLAGARVPQLLTDLSTLVDKYRANGTIYSYLDTVEPASVTNVTYDGLQALILNQMSPQDFASDIENAWEEAKADGKILKPGGVSE
jgi:raffinose/stachyose/melibiose transport system substrate-binding protein